MRAWIAFWNIFKKDVQTYYLKPPNISWGIIFPFSWTLMQLVRTPAADDTDLRSLLPGLVAMSILFGTTSMVAVTITFEKRSRSFDRLLTAPISLTTLVLAKMAGAVFFGALMACLPLLVGAFIVDLSGLNWAVAALGIWLMSISSAFLGLAIAVSAKEVFEAQTYANFFRFPMLFLSGFFLPIHSLPWLLRLLSYCLPLTYGADLLRWALVQAGDFHPGLDLAALAGFSTLLFSYCRWSITQKWIL